MDKSFSPLVSVIIPTYNRAHTLALSVNSVLNQTYKNIELIIVDDASTDETSKIVAEFRDDRVRYLCLSHNQGANVARNMGIAHARGEYIAFQDSDDEWLSHKLERQLSAFVKIGERKGVVYCKCQRIDEDGIPKRIFGEPFDPKVLLCRNYIDTPTMVVHRDCLQKEQFDENLSRRQDWEICLRLMQNYQFVFVPEVLVLSNMSQQSISQSSPVLEAYEYILAKHYHLISKNRKAMAEFHYNVGLWSIRDEQWQKGKTHLLQSLVSWPFNWRYVIRAMATLFGQGFYKAFFY